VAIGDARREWKQLDPAMTSYRNALATAQKSVSMFPREATIHNEVYIASDRIGRVHADRNQPDQALASFRQATSAVRHATDLNSRDPVLWSNLYLSELAGAKALRDSGRDNGELEKAYRNAVAAAIRAADLAPDNPVMHHQVGLARWWLGDYFERSGKRDESIAEYGKAIEAAQLSVHATKGNPNSPRLWNVLSGVQRVMGHLHRENDLKTALPYYRASAAAAEKAVQLDPASVEYRLDLAEALATQADALAAGPPANRVERSVALERAISELARLYQQGRLNDNWQKRLRDLEGQRRRLVEAR
jgi:tetratricopeptide (TPR) repeat protein